MAIRRGENLDFTSARQFVFLADSSEFAPPASSAAAAAKDTLAATPVMLAGAPVSADLPDAAGSSDRPKSEENQLFRRPVSCVISTHSFQIQIWDNKIVLII